MNNSLLIRKTVAISKSKDKSKNHKFTWSKGMCKHRTNEKENGSSFVNKMEGESQLNSWREDALGTPSGRYLHAVSFLQLAEL